MDIGTLAGPLITAICTIVVTIIGLTATGRARKAETAAKEADRAATAKSEEAERLRKEAADMDARTHRLIDQLQEDNDRLRVALRTAEAGAKGQSPGTS